MKKILFATSALVATAGMAAADVSFGGYGRFGLFYNEGFENNDTRVEQRFRLTITGTTETDAGVKFEARIRFQTDDGNSLETETLPGGDIVGVRTSGTSNVAQRSAAGFAVTSGGFRLDVGHVSDVIDSGDVVDYYGYGVGLTSFAEQSSGFALPASGFGTSGDDSRVDPTIKIRYVYGDFTVAASYTDDSTTAFVTDGVTLATVENDAEEWQVGVGYNFGDYSVGAAYGNRNGIVDNDFWAVTFGGEIGAFGFSLLVADSDIQDDTSYGASVKYDIGAATELRAVYSDNGFDAADETYAVGVRHSLGGGVTLAGGVGQNIAGNTVGDLGVIFNF